MLSGIYSQAISHRIELHGGCDPFLQIDCQLLLGKFYQSKFSGALGEYFIAGKQKCQNPTRSSCTKSLRRENGHKMECQVTVVARVVLTPTLVQKDTKIPNNLG